MSLLVHYTLKEAAGHDAQVAAMEDLVAGLKESGIDGLDYSCFSTDDPTKFIGVLEFPSDETFQAFQASSAFEAYRKRVGPTFANPPQTTRIEPIASTKT